MTAESRVKGQSGRSDPPCTSKRQVYRRGLDFEIHPTQLKVLTWRIKDGANQLKQFKPVS